jgi:hypothetical protein
MARFTEFAKRRESTVGLLAGKPKHFVSYHKELDLLVPTAAGLAKETISTIHAGADSLQINRRVGPCTSPCRTLYVCALFLRFGARACREWTY